MIKKKCNGSKVLADDRAGVFMIMNIEKLVLDHMLSSQQMKKLAVLAQKELSKKPMPFKELSYIIQLDRRGKTDCVFYDCDNTDFVKYIENFGFCRNLGHIYRY